MPTKQLLGIALIALALLQLFFSYKALQYKKHGRDKDAKQLNDWSKVIQVTALTLVLIYLFFGGQGEY